MKENIKILHQSEDSVAFCVKTNDHVMLISWGWFVYWMMPSADTDFSNSRFSHIVVFLVEAFYIRFPRYSLFCPTMRISNLVSSHTSILLPTSYLIFTESEPSKRVRGYKTLFVLNSVEQEMCPANKSQITNICKLFLAKHSWAWIFLC